MTQLQLYLLFFHNLDYTETHKYHMGDSLLICVQSPHLWDLTVLFERLFKNKTGRQNIQPHKISSLYF